jgi:hypothetical protein
MSVDLSVILIPHQEPTRESYISEIRNLTTVLAPVFLPSQRCADLFLGAIFLSGARSFRLRTFQPENFVDCFTLTVLYGVTNAHDSVDCFEVPY